jgi:hypothetical protein
MTTKIKMFLLVDLRETIRDLRALLRWFDNVLTEIDLSLWTRTTMLNLRDLNTRKTRIHL